MQFPLQSGVRVKDGAFRVSHPLNLSHKVVESGVSRGEMVTTPGAVAIGNGPGIDRGGTWWSEGHFRVMGDKLVSVSGSAITTLGTLASDGRNCSFAHGFGRFAVASSQRLYYWDGSSLSQVTDPDLGIVLDVTWIGGYFVTTDGEYIVVTELNDPTEVDPLKYGSAETVPDPIVGVDVVNEELVAVGRYSLQFFRNVGGTGFPFQNVIGAMVPYGAISAQAKCRIAGTLAFVGSGQNEPLGVFLLSQGAAIRISDEDVDAILAECADVSSISIEAREIGHERYIVVHAGEQSVALTFSASGEAQKGLWHRLQTDGGPYRPRNAVWAGGRHYVGDVASPTLGYLDDAETAHFGTEPGWSLDAGLLFNDGKGYILREVEFAGQYPVDGSTVFFSMTRDGELWSEERPLRHDGRRDRRVIFRPNVRCNRLAGFRLRGSGKVALARGDVQAEPLNA